MIKNPPNNVGDISSIPGLGRSPGEGNGNSLHFLPGKANRQRSLVGYRQWGCEESDITYQVSTQCFPDVLVCPRILSGYHNTWTLDICLGSPGLETFSDSPYC